MVWSSVVSPAPSSCLNLLYVTVIHMFCHQIYYQVEVPSLTYSYLAFSLLSHCVCRVPSFHIDIHQYYIQTESFKVQVYWSDMCGCQMHMHSSMVVMRLDCMFRQVHTQYRTSLQPAQLSRTLILSPYLVRPEASYTFRCSLSPSHSTPILDIPSTWEMRCVLPWSYSVCHNQCMTDVSKYHYKRDP